MTGKWFELTIEHAFPACGFHSGTKTLGVVGIVPLTFCTRTEQSVPRKLGLFPSVTQYAKISVQNKQTRCLVTNVQQLDLMRMVDRAFLRKQTLRCQFQCRSVLVLVLLFNSLSLSLNWTSAVKFEN